VLIWRERFGWSAEDGVLYVFVIKNRHAMRTSQDSMNNLSLMDILMCYEREKHKISMFLGPVI